MARLTIRFNFSIELNGRQLLPSKPPRKLVNEIKDRDDATCYYCGAFAPNGHADHIIPASRGGLSTLDNLVWSCVKCNCSKSDRTPQEWEDWREQQGQEKQEKEDRNKEIELKRQQKRELVLKLKAQGLSDTAIAGRVFVHKNTHYIRKVQKIIAQSQEV